MSKIDFSIIGTKFNNLTVVSFSHTDQKDSYWNCLCKCGVLIIKPRRHLKDGSLKSCGCISRSAQGLSKTRTYAIWEGMIARCYNPNRKEYSKYGGVGLQVETRWHVFSNFYSDMGECPPNFTIERKNNKKGYSSSNCKWASRKEQNRNHSRNRKLTFNGKTQCLAAWAEELNIPSQTLSHRLKQKFPIHIILSQTKLKPGPRCDLSY